MNCLSLLVIYVNEQRLVVQSLADTAEQQKWTINRLAPVYEQSKDLKKSLAELEKQTEEYQAREGQWISEKATLTERVTYLETALATLQGQVPSLEAANNGN